MDVSKLPKLSQTPAPPASPATDDAPPPPAIAAATSYQPEWCRKCHAPNAPNSRFCASCGAGLGGTTGAAPVEVGAEAWISIGLGVILLLISPRLLQFLSHKLFGTYFAPYVYPDGSPGAPYTSQPDFWSDLGVTLFAAVIILDGIIMVFARKKWLIATVLALTVTTTLYNLGFFAWSFQSGPALISALAVLFGGYIAVQQWRLLQRLRLPTL